MPGQAFAVRKHRYWLGLVFGLSAITCASAQTVDPGSAAPPAATVLKGGAAWQTLVGNTVVAQSRTGSYTEYYAPDGAVTHLDQDGKSTGKWTVEGDKVCFDFPEEDDRSCVDVQVDGGNGTFVDEDKSRDTFVISPGNAKNL